MSANTGSGCRTVSVEDDDDIQGPPPFGGVDRRVLAVAGAGVAYLYLRRR